MPDSAHKKKCDTVARLGKRISCVGLVLFMLLAAWWWRFITAEREHLVLYFSQSINGVSVGSPVKVMGIVVGQVESTGLRLPEEVPGEYYSMVKVVLDSKSLTAKGLPHNLANPQVLQEEIRLGLRGNLSPLSPMTGGYYVELSYQPAAPLRRVARPEEALAEIPTLDNWLVKNWGTLTDRLVQFSEMDVEVRTRDFCALLDDLLVQTQPEKIARLNDTVLAHLEHTHAVLNDPALLKGVRDLNAKVVRLRATLADQDTSLSDRMGAALTELAALQQNLTEVGSKISEVGAALDLQSAMSRLALHRLLLLRHSVDEWINQVLLPVRLALPRGGHSPGSAPAER